ncbi:hypothetical protein NDU88_006290 [Pleurodeles waltl]|uniref:Uncharacterized protein n=1 Tax=Pleurodeles waltl TaxID=8319 RepID=A0AAV7N886_PLEWA|nr:hypothetical protein NDU88_006290 [Pleurodeles waltl]
MRAGPLLKSAADQRPRSNQHRVRAAWERAQSHVLQHSQSLLLSRTTGGSRSRAGAPECGIFTDPPPPPLSLSPAFQFAAGALSTVGAWGSGNPEPRNRDILGPAFCSGPDASLPGGTPGAVERLTLCRGP